MDLKNNDEIVYVVTARRVIDYLEHFKILIVTKDEKQANSVFEKYLEKLERVGGDVDIDSYIMGVEKPPKFYG